jgi:hypothetical protein
MWPPGLRASLALLCAQALGSVAGRGDEAVVSGLAAALCDDDWAVQKVCVCVCVSVCAKRCVCVCVCLCVNLNPN